MQSRTSPGDHVQTFKIAGYPQEQVETEFAGMLNAEVRHRLTVDPRPVSTGLSCCLRMSRIFGEYPVPGMVKF